MLKVICFDLWKTLVGENSNLKEYFKVFQKEIPDLSYDDFVSLDEQILMTQNIELFEGLTKIADKLGINNPSMVREVTDKWIDSVNDSFIYEDVLPTLQKLKDKGYKLGLITNTTKVGWEAVQNKYNLLSYFDYPLLSYNTGLIKPDLRVFRLMETISGCKGTELMMIGDSKKSDIEITKSINWETFLIARPDIGLPF